MGLKSPSEGRIAALATRLMNIGGPPAGLWATAAVLESLGIDDHVAVRDYQHTDVFCLAERVEEECRCLLAEAPELTVSMPARNREALIGEAIASVLTQQDVDFELVIVDDGSTDGTAEVVEAFDDPRIRLLRNAERRGIYYCHNRVVRESLSPFIAHCDSDDLLLAGALAAMVELMRSRPDIGQGHCRMMRIDAQGRCLRDSERRFFKVDRRRHAQPLNYRRGLLVHGTLNNGLRTYRREALHSVGGFNEGLRLGGDWEMGLRLAQSWRLGRTPRTLYCVRVHAGRSTSNSVWMGFVWWISRVRDSWPLLRAGELASSCKSQRRWLRLMLSGLRSVIVGRLSLWRLRALLQVVRQRLEAVVSRRTVGARRWLYGLCSRGLRWVPLRRHGPRRSSSPPRIVYFIWQYPILSQTFVRRELDALRAAGVEVEVVSELAGEELIEPRTDANRSTLLGDVSRTELIAFLRRLCLFRPAALVHSTLFVIGNDYGAYKSFSHDLRLLARAIRLAYLLRRGRATRVHSPWASRSALVAMVAARLAGVAYSVQARAHDIFRSASQAGLRERLLGADVVVTNAEHNVEYLDRLIDRSRRPPSIARIYEGIVPQDLVPSPRGASGRLRLLCVARWIEEKGLVHLLRALSRLRDEGLEFDCEIVGGPEEPTYTNYRIALQCLHRRLGLQDRVVLTGAQSFDRIVERYRKADLFVLPCVEAANGGRDISPQSIVEAMAMELPVVSSRSGGIPELVVDGETGLLCAPGDEVELAAAIRALAGDAGMRRRFGQRGRRRALQCFDIRRNARGYLDLFGCQRRSEDSVRVRTWHAWDDELFSGWEALLERATNHEIYQTPQWNRAWWQAFGDGSELKIVTIEAGGRFEGLAPFMITKRADGCRVLEFIGTSNSASDYADVILPLESVPLFEHFREWLIRHRREWDLIGLSHLRADTPNLQDFMVDLGPDFGPWKSFTISRASTLRLGGDEGDHAVLRKKSLRRHLKYFESRGELIFHTAGSVDEILAELPSFFDQHIRRRRLANTESQFLAPRERCFYRLLTRSLWPRGWLHFSSLHFDGEPIAYHFGFSYRGKYIWYKPSFEPRWAARSPGEVLIRHLLEYVLDGGFSELDFTVGIEDFKARFCNEEVDILDLRLPAGAEQGTERVASSRE